MTQVSMTQGSNDRGLPKRRGARLAFVMGVALVVLADPAAAQQSSRPGVVPVSDKPNYPGSPYHGAIDGNGNPIPCRCRFQGRDFRLGEIVCMSTHVGTVLTRCDLADNNTSWIPSDTPCVISRGRGGSMDIAAR